MAPQRSEIERADPAIDGPMVGGQGGVHHRPHGQGPVLGPRLVVHRTDADDRETLQDLLIAAFNDAAAKAEAVTQEKMSAVTAGLPLPPGMKLF